LPGKQLLRHRARRRDENGAELIEFAFIAVILVALLYSLVFFGVAFATKITISQAVSDGSRAGITSQTPSTAESNAVNQASDDLGWLPISTPVCGTSNGVYACMSPCSGSITSCTTPCTASSNNVCTAPCSISNSYVCPATADASTVALMIVASESSCQSSSSNTCLTTNATYYYKNAPIVPGALGLSLLAPTTVVANSTQEVSTPTP